MSERSHALGAALFDFRAQYLADSSRGRILPVDSYARRFPGFEQDVRSEYERLVRSGSSDETSAAHLDEPEPRRIAQYLLIAFLGRGGQGEVHLAEDTRLKRKVALKLLTGFGHFSPEARRRFQREAEMASRLDDPGICTIYESAADESLAYIAMRYVEGETLARRIERTRAGSSAADERGQRAPCLPATRTELCVTLLFFERAARALHVAHEAGVLHRDIKPANLMITPTGAPVILDFGLARELEPDGEALTRTADQLGTPRYMSPEQVDPRGRRVDRRTDVHSLGVTLFECLTLESPWQAPTLEQLYLAVLRDPPRDARRLNSAVPRDLGIVLETALEKDRDRRYSTALDLAEDLRRVREREAIRARPTGAWLKSLRWVQRHPARALSAASASFVAASLVFIAIVSWQASDVREANSGLTSLNVGLRQHDEDGRMRERLLDLLADVPTRAGWHDWAAEADGYLAAFANYAIPLDGSLADHEIESRVLGARSRDSETGELLLDGIYRLAWTLDDVEITVPPDDVRRPIDLRREALRSPRWIELRGRLRSRIAALESDPWRKDVWERFQSFVATREDRLGSCAEPHALASRSAADILRLAELSYLVRRDASVLALYDLADEHPDASQSVRYAIRLGRGTLRTHYGDARGAVNDLELALALRPRSAPTFMGLARARCALKDPARALASARQAVLADPRSASAHLLLAQIASSEHLEDEALEHASIAHDLAPRDPTALTDVARAELARGCLEEALDAWTAAARLDSATLDSWRELGRALWRARGGEHAWPYLESAQIAPRAAAELACGYAQSAIDEGARSEAVDAWSRARELVPCDAAVVCAAGTGFAACGELERASDAFERALALQPDLAAAHAGLGRVLLGTHAPGAAYVELDRAAALAPEDEAGSVARIQAAFESGLQDRALELARAALDRAPADRRRHARLIAMLENRGSAESIVEACIAALDADPNDDHAFLRARMALPRCKQPSNLDARLEAVCLRHPDAIRPGVLRGMCAAFAGDDTRAIESMERAAELDSSSSLAFECSSDVLALHGAWNDSAHYARSALERAPRSVDGHWFLARALARLGDLEGAARIAAEGSDLEPRHAGLLGELGGVALALGQPDLFLERARPVLRSDPARLDARHLIVGALRWRGDFDEAEAVLAEGLRQTPTNPGLLMNLADTRFEAGRWSAAVDAYSDAALAQHIDPAQLPPRDLAVRRARFERDGASTDRGASNGDALVESCRLDGDFAAAARVLESEPPWGSGTSARDAATRLEKRARIAARAAEVSWTSARTRVVAVEASSPRAEPASSVVDEDDGAAERHAEFALDWLEAGLAERANVGASNPAALEQLEQTVRTLLVDRELLILRVPPPDSAWKMRADSYFWSLRRSLTQLRNRR